MLYQPREDIILVCSGQSASYPLVSLQPTSTKEEQAIVDQGKEQEDERHFGRVDEVRGAHNLHTAIAPLAQIGADGSWPEGGRSYVAGNKLMGGDMADGVSTFAMILSRPGPTH